MNLSQLPWDFSYPPFKGAKRVFNRIGILMSILFIIGCNTPESSNSVDSSLQEKIREIDSSLDVVSAKIDSNIVIRKSKRDSLREEMKIMNEELSN